VAGALWRERSQKRGRDEVTNLIAPAWARPASGPDHMRSVPTQTATANEATPQSP